MTYIMRNHRFTKERMIRAKIHKDILLFCITETTLAVQQEDGGLWSPGIIFKPNNNDHRVRLLYNMSDMKPGRLMTWNSKHKGSTSITAEECLHEKINTSLGMSEDIFAQAISKELYHLHKQCSFNTTKET